MPDPISFNENPDEFPLHNHVVRVEGIATMEYQTALASQGKDPDIVLLRSLDLPDFLNSGATDASIYKFIVESEASNQLRTAQDILNAVRAKHFASEHIENLNLTSLPHPGYHPGTVNDEIHTDFENQIFFPTTKEAVYDWKNEWYAQNYDSNQGVCVSSLQPPSPPTAIANLDLSVQGSHGELKQHVRDQLIWYINLHTTKKATDFSDMVVLFAVGVSPVNPRRLVGLIASQVCHNYCD